MKNYKYYLLLYFLLWVLLFEFILPVNNILPKPSIVLVSFSALWEDYHLPANFLSTISAIYLSLIAAYFLISFSISNLIKAHSRVTEFVLSLEWFAEFIPGIVIGLMLVYWFPGSEFIEFVFAFFTIFTSILIKIQNEIKNVPEAFINSARSLGIKESITNREVIWKAIQPALMNHIIILHFYIWSMMIAFEFIKGGYGLGSVFRRALEYQDLSALFSIFIITGVTIYLGSASIKYFKTKFFPWKVN